MPHMQVHVSQDISYNWWAYDAHYQSQVQFKAQRDLNDVTVLFRECSRA